MVSYCKETVRYKKYWTLISVIYWPLGRTEEHATGKTRVQIKDDKLSADVIKLKASPLLVKHNCKIELLLIDLGSDNTSTSQYTYSLNCAIKYSHVVCLWMSKGVHFRKISGKIICHTTKSVIKLCALLNRNVWIT